MYRIVLVVAVFLASLHTGAAQSSGGGGLQVFAGYRSSLNALEDYMVGSSGGGPTIGADARLLGGGLYFLLGGSYSIQGGDGEFFSVDTDSGYTITSARIGIGFKLFKINRKISVRSKVAGSVHFLNGLETDVNPDTGEDYLPNDSFAGGLAGLGIDIGILTIDLDYEVGLINAINQQSESTVDFITLTAGVFF